jgi:ubiquinone/menaquinone biosynthesis C-methylase UbiE
MNKPENPWLEIPIVEYVGHISDSYVRQYKMLNKIFHQAYSFKQPANLLVLGATDGNGLEHVSKQVTEQVVAVDINHEYTAIAQCRFHTKLPQCDFICEDVEKYKFPANYFDMIHGALIFEYVDYQKLLVKIAKSLKIGGVLSTVIQLEDANAPRISETKFTSLQKLASIMKTVDISVFRNCTFNNHLREIHQEQIKPYGEKSFYYGIFERVG